MPQRMSGLQALRRLEMTSRSLRALREILLRLNPSAQNLQELRQPLWMGGPGWRRHEIAVHVRLVHGQVHVFAAGILDIGLDRRISGARLSFEHAGRGEDLGGMTDGRNR